MTAALKGCGTQTLGLVAGGIRPPSSSFTADSFEWDGSSWTSGGSLNTARATMAQAGIQTAAIFAGGNPGNNAVTETYNGTSFTEVSDLNTGRAQLAGLGTGSTNTAALASGGYISSDQTAVEEFTSPATSTVSFTVS